MLFQKGHPSYHTEESIKKIKESLKGRIPWNKGEKGLQKSKYKGKKIQWNTGRTHFKKEHIPWNKGKEHFKIKGKNHWNWQGGKILLIEQIRKCFKYRQWRSDIFQKDNYICQECGYDKGKILNAHHYPKKLSKIIIEYQIKTLEEALDCEELWNINNGQTLCKKCHEKTFK